jgi:cyclohexyl-isocyanide hydratase
MNTNIEVGFLLFPNLTQLDLTGPAQVLSRVPNTKVHLVWKDLDPVMTDVGFSINPTTTFEGCPQLDVLCVPGGSGIGEQMLDQTTLSFLRKQSNKAKYITSVCNGSLILAASGVLRGHKSACHWIWSKYLSLFGVEPMNQRVVKDGKYISGGGVTAGIDFAYELAAELAGEDIAKRLQLALEYDPAPPFDCGSPEKAGQELVNEVLALQKDRITAMEAVIQKALTNSGTR